MPSGVDALPRFRRYISVADTGCWLWTGSLTAFGYGQFSYLNDGKRYTTKAHIFAWRFIADRHVPEGQQLDHTCHHGTDCLGGVVCTHRMCVNPDHLEAVTPRENTMRSLGNTLGARRRTMEERTACRNGHPWPDHLIVRGRTHRCAECHRKANREYASRKRRAA